MSSILCIDIGNTHTRVGLFENQTLQRVVSFTTESDFGINEWIDHVQTMVNPFEINVKDMPLWIACVVPPLRETLAPLNNAHWVGADKNINFTIARVAPETLGPDIIAGIQAVVDHYSLPAFVIDAGTATTIGAIDANAQFLGGAIVPGLGISAHALIQKAHALDDVPLTIPPHAIATTTETAVQSGLLYGHAGMIESMVDRMQQEAGFENPSVVMTGGAIKTLQNILPTHYQYHEQLVLEGIQNIAHHNRA